MLNVFQKVGTWLSMSGRTIVVLLSVVFWNLYIIVFVIICVYCNSICYLVAGAW